MEIENASYDATATVTLRGVAGLFKGERITIHVGQRVVIGRSRMCDVSIARAAECLRLGKEALERHRSYRKISRRHLQITLLSRDLVEIEDLSTNGTLVDGHRIDRLQIPRFVSDDGKAEIEFGEGEMLWLEANPKGEAPAGEECTEFRKQPRPSDHISHNVDRTPVP